MKPLSSKIIGVGGYLPDNIITNDDLSKLMETSNEWIVSRTGITKRHIAPEGLLTSDLATSAALIALKNANLNPSQIDAIIVSTTTPDYTFPATAVKVQANLRAANAFAFDIQAVCAGFIYALNLGNSLIISGQAKNVLVIGAEIMSKLLDWNDRKTAVLFGDGAGAIILSSSTSADKGILAIDLHSDGCFIDILKTTGGIGIGNLESNFLLMKGGEVFKHAVDKMHSSILKVIKKADLELKDIDLFIPHQANLRIIENLREKLNLAQEQTVVTVDIHANTSAASIPLAYYEAIKNKQIKSNQILLLSAIGGGLSWGSIIMRI